MNYLAGPIVGSRHGTTSQFCLFKGIHASKRNETGFGGASDEFGPQGAAGAEVIAEAE